MSVVAFIGKTMITEHEANLIRTIASTLGLYKHKVVTTQADGTNAAVRQGVGDVKGDLVVKPSHAFETFDLGVIYGDTTLVERLEHAKVLPDPRIAVMTTIDQLEKFCDEAVIQGYRDNMLL